MNEAEARRTHGMAITRDYISQPRISKYSPINTLSAEPKSIAIAVLVPDICTMERTPTVRLPLLTNVYHISWGRDSFDI